MISQGLLNFYQVEGIYSAGASVASDEPSSSVISSSEISSSVALPLNALGTSIDNTGFLSELIISQFGTFNFPTFKVWPKPTFEISAITSSGISSISPLIVNFLNF